MMDVFSLPSPSNRFSPPHNQLLIRTMLSTTAVMGSTPSEGSSPFVTNAWGLRLFGPEPYPPFVGEGEFTIINPDFWGASKEEQDAMKGWYVFHAVSLFPFECYSYIDEVFIQWIESIN